MEKLQGAVNPCLVGEDLDASWLDEFVSNYAFEDPYNNTEDLLANSDDKMPFMQMLQGVESAGLASVPIIQEPNYFQLLLKLQHQKMEHPQHYYCSNFASTTEVECTVKSETCVEEHKHEHEHEHEHEHAAEFAKMMSNNVAPKERRKRKRASRAMKNKEEAETQRMTHIAVERNRRRLMNDHLNALRSLMPPSYVQRGDQASIIGGAIDFVKDMEQLLQSLEGQKRMKQCHEDDNNTVVISSTTSTTSSSNLMNNNDPIEDVGRRNNKNNINSEELSVEKRGEVGDIKVVVIQSHVNLKIECQRRPGQLMRAILGFEQLRLTILHLNITSLHTLVHYSFNLKIEDDCKLGTTDEVLKAVHHVFGLTNVH